MENIFAVGQLWEVTTSKLSKATYIITKDIGSYLELKKQTKGNNFRPRPKISKDALLNVYDEKWRLLEDVDLIDRYNTTMKYNGKSERQTT